MERYLTGIRHVEVQVLADGDGHAIHLGERDCSIQRRHQKIIEEGPSPGVSAALRDAMGDAALVGVRAIDYSNAGTIEFLLGPDGHFYFMEMNTRIQVEHPVTELITGIDLVKWQLQIAAGERLTLAQKDVRIRGHAVECRINAEDPAAGFAPSPGQITTWQPPQGDGVRVDTHVTPGYVVPPFYDSLLAKLIVRGTDRADAIARALAALAAFKVEGVPTTIPMHRAILASAAFAAGDYDTRAIPGWPA
jgi:acetyl-CoA carboxylase biotin carboxylase subunit